jgi:2-hydroxy-palmitic acid dioxygenase Mpo1-like
VVASYQEFAAEHRTQHLTPFNRWCAVVGNSMAPAAAFTALTGRPKVAAALLALGNVVLISGHVAEGNAPRAVRDFVRHPMWSIRADVAVATATIRDSLKQRQLGSRLC